MTSNDFIYARKSIRKFKDTPVPTEDLKEMIKAATYAPSGKNFQNWHFVVVSDRNKIDAMANAVLAKNELLASYSKDEESANKFRKFAKYSTVFKNAPHVILIFAGPYPTSGLQFLKDKSASMDEIHTLLKPSPGVQNVAAAMENLLLAAANMGYGGCWMTGPNYASKEICEVIGFEKEGYYLACMTPMGVPESFDVNQPPRKAVDDVTTFI